MRRSVLRGFLGAAALLAVAIAVALMLGELAVRAAFHESMDFDMEMWKYATQVKTSVADPRVVHEHGADRRAHLMGVELATNSDGMRDRSRPRLKPAGEFRVVVLGDSVTLGWGVEGSATYPSELERLLNLRPPHGFPQHHHYAVLNFGVGNYNTVQEVALLKHRALDFDPDLIIVGYFINDAEPTPVPPQSSLLVHSYLAAFLVSRARLLSPTYDDYRSYYRNLYDPAKSGWKEALAAFRELGALSRERRIPALVAILPEMHQLGPDYPFHEVHQLVARELSLAGVPFVDLVSSVEPVLPPSELWVSPGDAHPNARAMSQMARGLYAAMEARATELVRAELRTVANRVR
jgi:lysophospholipase L1-like esterase